MASSSSSPPPPYKNLAEYYEQNPLAYRPMPFVMPKSAPIPIPSQRLEYKQNYGIKVAKRSSKSKM